MDDGASVNLQYIFMGYLFRLTERWSYRRLSKSVLAVVLIGIFVMLHVVLWWLWDVEVVAVIVASVLLLGGLVLFRSWKLLATVVLVMIGGTLQDIYFINSGLWAYMGGGSDMPNYIPIVWGIIAMLLVVLYKVVWIVLRKFPQQITHRPPGTVIGLTATALALTLALFALANLSSAPIVLIGVFLVISATYLLFMRSVPLAIVSAITLVFGALGELIGVSFGAWSYGQGALGGVPIYIFFGWDIIGAVVVGTYISLGGGKNSKKFDR